MARRVRTTAGTKRYNKPIGALISQSRLRSVEDLVPKVNARSRRSASSARSRKRRVTGDLATVNDAIDIAKINPKLLNAKERNLIEHHAASTRRKALRETGSPIKSRKQALSDVRSASRQAGRRTVAANPLSGKLVVHKEVGAGLVRRASVARARARQAPASPAYVGKRRARD